MKLKRTVIIEFDRVRITTPHCAKNIFKCESCGAETEFLSRREASELAKIMRTEGLNFNPAHLHFHQPDEQQILVCLDSIIAANNSLIIKKLTG